jgi:hypothetical protein
MPSRQLFIKGFLWTISTPSEMTTLFKKLEECADKARCDLLIQYHSDLFQIETSLLYDSKEGYILIHVPMMPKNSLLRLFWLHPFLLPLYEMHHLIMYVQSDILAISSTDTHYSVQLSSTDMLSCHWVNQIFMCDSFGVMYRNFNTCPGVLGAFAPSKWCQWENRCTSFAKGTSSPTCPDG